MAEEEKKEEKIEELEEPLKVEEPTPLTIPSPEKTKTSNLEDDLKNQLTPTQKTDLTDAGATTLHKHDHGLLDGLADDDHPQYVKDTGDETIAGVKTFGSIPVLPASNPTTDNQATRKAYVDSKAGGNFEGVGAATPVKTYHNFHIPFADFGTFWTQSNITITNNGSHIRPTTTLSNPHIYTTRQIFADIDENATKFLSGGGQKVIVEFSLKFKIGRAHV